MLKRIALICMVAGTLNAEDEKKPAANAEIPILASAQPLAVSVNATNKLALRGKNLADVNKLQLSGSPAALSWKLKAEENSKTDKSTEKKAATADSTLEVEFSLPADSALGTNLSFIATNPKGESKPLPIYVVAAGKLLEEKEPNDGFKTAQRIEPGFCIAGSMSVATDVDVFRISAKGGQKIRFEVVAAQLGSPLDGSLTLYTDKGSLLATNDDAAGRDPGLTQTMVSDGDYFVALTCVNELPAKTSAPYVFKISLEK